MNKTILLALLLSNVLLISVSLRASPKKILQFSDLMQFKESRNLTLSQNNEWIALSSAPDRGITDVLAIRCSDGVTLTLPGHEEPVLSSTGAWLIAFQAQDPNQYPKPDEKKPQGRTLTLLETSTKKKQEFNQVYSAAFDSGGQWLFIRTLPELGSKEDKDEKEEKALVLLIHLSSNQQTSYQNIITAAMDPDSPKLALVGQGQLTLLDLSGNSPVSHILCQLPDQVLSQAVWSEKNSRLAVLASLHKKDEMAKHPEHTVFIWYPKLNNALEIPRHSLPINWLIPPKSPLKWDHSGKQLCIGTRPVAEHHIYNPMPIPHPVGTRCTAAPYTEQLTDRTLDIWHWQDPRIKSQDKAQQKRLSEQTYTALYTLKTNNLQQLGGPTLQKIQLNDGCPQALGFDNRPYSQEMTWDGFYDDVYLVDLKTKTRDLVVKRNQHPLSLSSLGRYLAYFRDKHWHLYDAKTKTHKNLTALLPHSFADEDHDIPEAPPPYGLAGWQEGDKAIFVYDRYDIWAYQPGSGVMTNMTAGKGRQEQISFRRQKTKASETTLPPPTSWLLTAFSEKEKWTHFYRISPQDLSPRALTTGRFSHRFLLAGEDQTILLFSRERLEVFPDIWISDFDLIKPKQLTRLNPQIEEFNWGRSELFKWKSDDGKDLEGVLIKPEDYQPGKRYPVIVYYYELSADRLLRYNQTVINHRPCFPLYASTGYLLFLPDIRFQTGRPGQSAVKCLVPGVLKLIDSGLADPRAIALHGHSWSGYQTAFIVTQTDLFACALAGAPVANMTSAYSGIRWGEGVARQFQYEKSQSRIGKNLFEAPHLYLENSPVFFAERINTPLLIEHGDEDEAVPWYQSIELYLAMRRLQKPCVFLQYNHEPHHLKQYANKLDYSIKMKEFFDHFLKGAPAPEWWTTPAPTPTKAPFEKKSAAPAS